MSQFWRYFISNGRGGLGCGGLGLLGHEVPILNDSVGHLDLIQRSGVEVWGVEWGGPAHQAGIKENDVIVALGDHPTECVRSLHRVMKKLPGGIPVPIILVRDKSRLERWIIASDYRDPARRR